MKKNIIKILIIFLTIILIYTIAHTYAAYKTMIQGSANSNINPWVIFVNNENIASTQIKTFTINEIINENENIANGKIAPGAIVKLPIEIDATQTKNMDIKYDITIDELNKNQANFKIMGITEENINSEVVKSNENTYTGIITKEQISNNTKHKLLVSVIWENDENNNEKDTALGTSEEKQILNIQLKVNISQYNNI